MNYIPLDWADLLIALGLMALVIIVSVLSRLGLHRDLLIGSARTLVQLIGVGYVLRFVFELERASFVLLVIALMLMAGAIEGRRRQSLRIPGIYGIFFISVGVAAAVSLLFVIFLVLRVDPWYKAQYFIPLGGLVIGNAINGVALAVDRLSGDVKKRRAAIEAALALGASPRQALGDIIPSSVKAAMIPSVNALMLVGLVQLPGVMTGQIIAGINPLDAVKYQVVVMYMWVTAVALASIVAALLSYRQFFTGRAQLRGELLR